MSTYCGQALRMWTTTLALAYPPHPGQAVSLGSSAEKELQHLAALSFLTWLPCSALTVRPSMQVRDPPLHAPRG
jgi:hypothetical protein